MDHSFPAKELPNDWGRTNPKAIGPVARSKPARSDLEIPRRIVTGQSSLKAYSSISLSLRI